MEIPLRYMSKALTLASLVCLVLFAAPAGDESALRGYSAEGARMQREWETKFRALPRASDIGGYVKRLSARPHHVGSPYDKDNAQWILSKFKEWGLEANIETFDVLFPTPKERAVELIAPGHFTAKLQEPTVSEDPTSAQHGEQLPTYNAYSIDGDVTAPLVYVNYGIPEDYEQLERLGVSVKGAVVIARYGASWRGIKPKVAAEHGAIGCIIYSDPHEDGYFEGEVFPKGAWRNRDGVQRGSVMDMPVYPGDPLTPASGPLPKPSAWRSKTHRPSPKSRCFPSLTATRSRCWRRWKAVSPPQAGAGRCPSPTTSGLVRPGCASK
jgi:N-acetylated-alpha-linked acidic dipeptidase